MSAITTPPAPEQSAGPDHAEDRGAILVMVLVMMVIGTLIVLPILMFTTSVFRAGTVETAKAESVEAARGGTWVALSDAEDLFDTCNGGSLPSSLSNVTTTCTVLSIEAYRAPEEVPYHAAAVQSDRPVPPQVVDVVPSPAVAYDNPNTTATNPDDYDVWLDAPDWTNDSTLGKVWVPNLPVQATSSGGLRDTVMLPGTQDPAYASCRVFFPGTFNIPIDLDGPTYFTSGVYYFTEPITIKNGADVVVGNGAEAGCTTDFEAIAFAQFVPDPLNMSGLGGTFVLGGDARITIDDSGSGDVRFAMNQRYVSQDETSVLASANVSIVSVNGTHEPLVAPEVLGDDLDVPGVIGVPASRVGTAGTPLAAASGYTPSVLTPKPTEPDAPTNVTAADYQRGSGGTHGRLTVTWDAPNENGSLITSYVAEDTVSGQTCSPPNPTPPDTELQPSCTITGLSHDVYPDVRVKATNAVGDSPWSDVYDAPFAVDLSGATQSPVLDPPDAPQNPAIGTEYSDGVEITWDPPADDGGGPITGYRVTATDVLVPTNVFTCDAWWNETSCVLPANPGLVDDEEYDIEIVARQHEGPPFTEYQSPPALISAHDVDLGGSLAPIQTAAIPTVRVPEPILSLMTVGNYDNDVRIDGYISVPQGRVEIGAAVAGKTDIILAGGIVAAELWVDTSGLPAYFDVEFNNPVGQKRIRLQSTASGQYTAMSDAVVQVNRSGSIAINSWIVQ